jgi:glyoxylase-like metal-dependent hydrolase (beta-lactamase superfamily II)
VEPLALGAARLHRLVLPLPLALREVNVYLVEGPRGAALVDSGMATPAAHQALADQLRERGVEAGRIGQLFITHLHLDHFGQADWLRERGARISMPRIDSERIQYWFGHPEFDEESLAYFVELGAPPATLARARGAMASMRAGAPPFAVDDELDDGQRIELAGETFEVVLTPGHSPGHACLHHPASGTLLVGDHVLPLITPNVSLSHETGEDPLGDYRRSLRKVRGRGFTLGLPAHGPGIADLDRRIDEILAHHDEREALLLSLLGDRTASCYELGEGLFEISRLDGWETWMAVGETRAHLRALEVSGRVTAVRRGGLTLFRAAQ